ncbi:MAG: ectonucleotide pyrophosphatase/phosphodiesterase [Acidobacteriota bacterium]
MSEVLRRRTAARRLAFLATLLPLLSAGDAAGVPPPGSPSGPAETVVLVSIDGLRWDGPEWAGAPNLARMRREGASAGGLVPPFPANTFPAHATIATGVHPDRHGILNNSFLDRERGPFHREDDASWLLAEPLWVTAERQGVRAAVYHWVFSYTPWRGIAATIRVPFSPGVPDAEKVDRILEWLRRGEAERPDLIMSYLGGVDSAAHRHGPRSAAARRRTLSADRQIGRLLRAVERLDRPAALVVVSDHGMSEVTVVHRLDRILTGPAGEVRTFSSGATSNLYCGSAAACAAARRFLGRIEGIEIFEGSAMPAALRYRHPSRVGDLVAIAPPASYFADRAPKRPRARGMHGYRPEDKAMWGVFHAWGSGVRPGSRRVRVAAVDVAPFICRLLGIDCPDGIDGTAPAELLSGVRSPEPPGRRRPRKPPAPAAGSVPP